MAERAVIIEQFKRLPAQDKLELIDELWREAATELRSQPLSAEVTAFLDERFADAEENSDGERDWADVRAELLAEP